MPFGGGLFGNPLFGYGGVHPGEVPGEWGNP